MSYLSDLSLDGDKDNNSIFESSMYVLPPKTALNSSIYLNPHDRCNSQVNFDSTQSMNSRKMGSNIEIPSYKGFSIAKGDYKSIIQVPSKTSKLIIDGVKMDDKNIKRKQNAVKSDRGNSRSVEFLKRLHCEKLKYPLHDETNIKVKTDDKIINQITRTESYWENSRRKKPGNIETVDRSKDNNVKDHSKSYNPMAIKDYIDKKHLEQKNATKEKCQLEKEKQMRIQKNLRTLSEHQRNKRPILLTENTDKNKKKLQRFLPLPQDHQMIDDDQTEETNEETCSTDATTDSCVSRHSILRQLTDWQPLDREILESYANRDRQGIKMAIDNNKHVINILDNISLMKDKIQSSTQKIFEFNKQRNFREPAQKQELQLDIVHLSDSDMSTEDNSNNSSDTISEVIKNVKKNLVTEINLTVPKNKIRRKKYFDNVCSGIEKKQIKSPKNIQIDDNAYSDCVSRLLDENKKRYERSLEPPIKMFIQSTNKITKPTAPVRPYHPESQSNFLQDTLKGDPLRFMNVYQKSTQRNVSKSIEASIECNSMSKHIVSNPNEQLSPKPTSDASVVPKSLPIVIDADHESCAASNITGASDSLTTKQSIMKADTEVEHSDSSETTFEDRHLLRSFDKQLPSNFNSRKITYEKEARLSPSSLERQFRAELDYCESVDVCMQQLLATERLQGVAIAQQETVSLAQLLKARQWQEGRLGENKEQIEQFTNILENFSRNYASHTRQKPISSSMSNTTGKTLSESKGSYSSKSKAHSSTETDASEIEEEIVESLVSSTSTPKIAVRTNVQKPVVKPSANVTVQKKERAKSVSLEESEILEMIDNITGEVEKTDSEDKSIKEILSQYSADSSSTFTVNKNSSPKEISTDRSVESVHQFTKTYDDVTKTNDKSLKELSSASSVTIESISDTKILTESLPKSSGRDNKDGTDSIKEISTARSVTYHSDFTKTTTKKSGSNDESHSSEVDYSANTFENSTAKSCKDNFSADLDNSDLVARINALAYEKNKKKDLVMKLSKDRTRMKNIRKEKLLKDQIKHLNSQIEYLENEIRVSDVSVSSVSSIPLPIVKKPKRKEKKPENILPNHSSKSSSTSSSLALVIKSDDKQVSLDLSKDLNDLSSSSTLMSEKDAIQLPDDKKLKAKIEEIDTPRSVKQLQFGDINEEYSASDRDSSEIRTPSEKSRLSREVTDNGATKSKSEKFHFLNLNNDEGVENEIGNVAGDQRILVDDGAMMSARTIHSEMSDIIDECVDLSDREIDEIENFNVDDDVRNENNEESDKDQESSFKDLYSDKFTDTSTHVTEKCPSKAISEANDESISEKQLEYETSPESSESHPPIIPPRKKEKLSRAINDELQEKIPADLDTKETIEDSMKLIDSISEQMLADFMNDLVKYVNQNLKESAKNDYGSGDSMDNALFELEDTLSPDSYRTLIPWNDEMIVPLVEVAVEQLVSARMNRSGSTVMALRECANNLPEVFVTKNDDETINKIIRHNFIVGTSDKKPLSTPFANLYYIDKMFIYDIVLEVVQRIYSLDDEPETLVWMRKVTNLRRNKMIRLWRGSTEPCSVDLVKVIVKEELKEKGVLARQRNKTVKLTRLHTWFLKQHQDKIDKMLVDETIAEEDVWNMYEKLEEDIMFHWSDEILQQLLEEGVDDVLATTR